MLAEVGYADALIAYEGSLGLTLIDGHLRAETTPDEEVPVLVLDVSDDEADKILATLDPLASMAGRDNEKLSFLLDGINSESDHVSEMLRALAKGNYEPLTLLPPVLKDEIFDTGSAMNDVEKEGYEPTVQQGEVWSLGQHRLMCGNATSDEDVECLLDGESPNLLVTDPPYGVNYEPQWRTEKAEAGYFIHPAKRLGKVTNDDRADWSEAWELFPGAVVYCYAAAGDLVIDSGTALKNAGFGIRAGIIWRKANFPISRGPYTYQHENIWYAVRKGMTASWIGPSNASSVWEIKLDPNVAPDAPDGGHSTQKPLECMERPIRYHTGDVYDPFVGSGTTIIAAERLGRRCYAMEIEPRYCDVVIQRWEDYTGGKACLLSQ